ncbi:hypothetical protein Q0Z83_051690 [Actinoplanes sichuanensis]|uniref:Uncharacterized protein n=1 Tax=Actinoplanes sichuanensis TaxID=512349 RepID=A0ABW4ADD9_9ACTN|nr:hypothetical protein [Actinoplanes sichuanensis]BEL06978.1 hypothetical protein Q0Z83_051690 [Actinoplanes sichuanensis]
MAGEVFHQVPIPERFVLRVMSSITEWVEQEIDTEEPARTPAGREPVIAFELPPIPDFTGEADIWPAEHLLALSRDHQAKTAGIITKMLDHLSDQPGRFYPSSLIAQEIDVPEGSVTAALRWLNRYIPSRFGRSDRPFSQVSGTYGVTAAQAEAWRAVR